MMKMMIQNRTQLYLGDCIDVMNDLFVKNDNKSFIDLCVTSPPYDDLRVYDNTCEWTFDIFKQVANLLYKVINTGGVVVWVVNDQTSGGTESGTSFRQALYFKDIGFNLHDTMIFAKTNYIPLTHNRYEQEFEYMFVLSKGRPKTFNPIKIDCRYAGHIYNLKAKGIKTGLYNVRNRVEERVINDKKIMGNIWYYAVGNQSENYKDNNHPATFPYRLAYDHIISWSNENDTVLDCFMGSGTVGEASVNLNRNFIGIEKNSDYFNYAKKRLELAESALTAKEKINKIECRVGRNQLTDLD